MSAIQDHPLAACFPLLSESELGELGADMKANGQNHAIVLLDGKILDGRNRYRACLLAGLDPWTEDFGGDDPLSFVISENIKRRHLTESQRAMAGAELEKVGHGGDRTGQDANLHLAPDREEIAEQLHVSPRSVATAKKVKEEAEPEIVEAVKAGKLTVNAAVKASELPPKKQREIAKSDNPKKATQEAVKEAENRADADPLETWVGELNRICRVIDALKKEVEKVVESHPLGKKFVRTESITQILGTARSTIWQSRPTEECNCVRRDGKPHKDCRACNATGKCAIGRVLKGSK